MGASIRRRAVSEIEKMAKVVVLYTQVRKRQQELVECRMKPGDVERSYRRGWASEDLCYGCLRRQIVVRGKGSSSKKLTANVEDDVQRQEQGDLVNCFRESPQSQQTGCDKLVTDQQLMRLAKCFGKSWKQIGIEALGIENSKLEQIEEDNQNNLVMKTFTMLKAWKNKEKKKATPVQLYQLLSSNWVSLEPEAYDFLND